MKIENTDSSVRDRWQPASVIMFQSYYFMRRNVCFFVFRYSFPIIFVSITNAVRFQSECFTRAPSSRHVEFAWNALYNDIGRLSIFVKTNDVYVDFHRRFPVQITLTRPKRRSHARPDGRFLVREHGNPSGRANWYCAIAIRSVGDVPHGRGLFSSFVRGLENPNPSP